MTSRSGYQPYFSLYMPRTNGERGANPASACAGPNLAQQLRKGVRDGHDDPKSITRPIRETVGSLAPRKKYQVTLQGSAALPLEYSTPSYTGNAVMSETSSGQSKDLKILTARSCA